MQMPIRANHVPMNLAARVIFMLRTSGHGVAIHLRRGGTLLGTILNPETVKPVSRATLLNASVMAGISHLNEGGATAK